MRNKDTVFYRGKIEVSLDFSSEEISSDGVIVLLKKIEREHKMIRIMNNVGYEEQEKLSERQKEQLHETYGDLYCGVRMKNLEVNYLLRK